MENPIKMGWFGGKTPLFSETPFSSGFFLEVFLVVLFFLGGGSLDSEWTIWKRTYLGGETSNIIYVHPYLGKIPILTNIFQMGWNHQLAI